ncbi:MAG: hypothetical protein K0V04_13580 [Deltaproteobacteria bacterium]|nr:hypothetical protein [Deltaproteobacteria bacterium]
MHSDTHSSSPSTLYRSIGAALIGALSLNCTAIEGTDGSPSELESSVDADDDRSIIAILESPNEDPSRSHYELRAPQIDRLELRGMSPDGQELSRMTLQHHLDLDGVPWIQLEIDDEEIAMAGHLRLLTDEHGQMRLELDAQVEQRVVAIRLDPSNPSDAEIFGFPGAPQGEFSPLFDYDDAQGMASRMMTALARVGSLAPSIDSALAASAAPSDFRGAVTCGSCVLDAMGALGFSVACIAASVGAGLVCASPAGAMACTAAIATAAAACGTAFGDLSDFVEDCRGACADSGPLVDPCSGGCSCPGGPE